MKQYDIILVDPPWPYDQARMAQHQNKDKFQAVGIDDEYETMTMEEMKNLPIQRVTAKNCVLYMWATGPKMREAFELMDAWGFEYSTMAFVWDKRIPNPGWYSCSQIEYVLVGKKGTCPKRICTTTKQFLCETRTKHSKKPEAIQDRIENHWEDCEKLEIFARRYRTGWDCVGLELNGTIQDFLNGEDLVLRDNTVVNEEPWSIESFLMGDRGELE